jgi:hypothetical protein
MANTVQIMGLGGSVISADIREKELIGEFKNAGRERRPRASRWLSARMTSDQLPQRRVVSVIGVYGGLSTGSPPGHG